MRTRRRTNFLWGLALLAAAVILILNALRLIPVPIFDVLARAWPALLVLAGLSLILRPRVPLGSFAALLVSLALVAGVAAVSYSAHSSQYRDDYHEPVVQTVNPSVTLLHLQIHTLATDVELLRRLGDDRVISGEFVGSTESQIAVTYDDSDVAANFGLVETQPSQFPMLDRMGRGTLRLELPAGLPLDIEIVGASGHVVLNTNGLAVERMNLDLRQGDALVTLPVYQPLGSQPGDSLGTLAVRDGNIDLLIDPQIAARLELNRSGSGIDPIYDPNVYNYLVGDVLEARDIETSPIAVRYTITAPHGRITVRVPQE